MAGERREARVQARLVQQTRYPDAAAVLLAGSVVRGEATAHSDLDLVVLYERVAHARRESFVCDGWPVEAFVHDLGTLRYFFVEVDGRAGMPSLAAMVRDGVEVTAGERPDAQAAIVRDGVEVTAGERPDTRAAIVRDGVEVTAGERSSVRADAPANALCNAMAAAAKQLANDILAAGPPPWNERERQQRRYVLTDIVDDLRAPRSDAQRVAAGARLYELVADCILRAAGRWSARGKSIPRALAEHDRALAARFVAAFDALFAGGDAAAVIELVAEVLRPLGGSLFDGFRLDAPPTWRTPG